MGEKHPDSTRDWNKELKALKSMTTPPSDKETKSKYPPRKT
jgi:hypothetical protein